MLQRLRGHDVPALPLWREDLYQGDASGSYSSYNAIPWRIGLVTQANSAC